MATNITVNTERLLNHFIALCGVNTPPLHEKALIDTVERELRELGLECVRDKAYIPTGADSGNLIATLRGNVPGAPAIFLSAHFDTVEPTPNIQIRVTDGEVHTDGSTILGADDKGGIAAIIEGIRLVIENDLPHGDVQLVLTIAEEIGLKGATHIDEKLIFARMGYVLDTGPPVGTVVYTAPTHDIIQATITGRAAHAGFEPEKGVSAIQVAARAIDRMTLGRIDFETTANIGIIRGGSATNIICSEVVLKGEARSRNMDKLRVQEEHMLDVLSETACEMGAEVVTQVEREYNTYLLPTDSPVIQIARQAGLAIGLSADLREGGGGSDANVFNHIGIPACVIGTGMRKVHTHSECISVQDLATSAQWVVSVVQVAAAASNPGRD